MSEDDKIKIKKSIINIYKNINKDNSIFDYCNSVYRRYEYKYRFY